MKCPLANEIIATHIWSSNRDRTHTSSIQKHRNAATITHSNIVIFPLFPSYLCRLCSICQSGRFAPIRRSSVLDRAHWGPLDALSCPVTDTREHTHTQAAVTSQSSMKITHLPPNHHCHLPWSASSLDVIIRVIIHVLCFLTHTLALLPVCSLQTNYSFSQQIFFSLLNYFSKGAREHWQKLLFLFLLFALPLLLVFSQFMMHLY